LFDEHTRRLWAATEANVLGYSGISITSRATVISCRAILVGINEIKQGLVLTEGRIRKQGGVTKTQVHHQLDLMHKLESLVKPLTRGDPESPFRWTIKSIRSLSEELEESGYTANIRLVAALLLQMGYSLQGNRKTLDGKQHPDRNAQFEYINVCVEKELRASQPVISVDTK